MMPSCLRIRYVWIVDAEDGMSGDFNSALRAEEVEGNANVYAGDTRYDEHRDNIDRILPVVARQRIKVTLS